MNKAKFIFLLLEDLITVNLESPISVMNSYGNQVPVLIARADAEWDILRPVHDTLLEIGTILKDHDQKTTDESKPKNTRKEQKRDKKDSVNRVFRVSLT